MDNRQQAVNILMRKNRHMDKWNAKYSVKNMSNSQVDDLIKLDSGLYVKIGSEVIKRQDVKTHSKLAFKIWDTVENCYNEDISIDQDGDLFICHNGWGCEGGGGREEVNCENGRYEIHTV